MKKVAETKSRKTDWAAQVRKFKPELNRLTDAECQQLVAEACADINGAKLAIPHVRRR